MKKRLINLATICAVGLVCQTVFAGPSWRGTAESTFQQWTSWTTTSGYVSPDAGWHNDFGTPTMLVQNGELDLTIPNNPVFLPLLPKNELRVEVESQGYPSISFSCDYTGEQVPPMVPGFDLVEYSTIDSDNGWSTTILDILTWPKPVKETVTIKGYTNADMVSVDTRCIPEPTTILLLGFGARLCLRATPRRAAILRRKRS